VWNRQGAQGVPGLPGRPGATGSPGPQGDPGPLPTTLPSRKTLRGYFMVNAEAPGDTAFSQISFPFPLAAAPSIEIHQPPSTSSHCPGDDSNPEAAPGYLCVYYNDVSNLGSLAPANSSRFGTGLVATPGISTPPVGTFGAWAVTAP